MGYSEFVSAVLVRVQRFTSGHADLKTLSYIATVYQRLPPLPVTTFAKLPILDDCVCIGLVEESN
jgi:hypothetical protein